MATVVCLVTQTCLMLCNPLDCSPPGSSVRGIFSCKNPGVVAISSSRGSFWPRDQTHVSFVSCIAGRVVTYWAIGKAPSATILLWSHAVHGCLHPRMWKGGFRRPAIKLYTDFGLQGGGCPEPPCRSRVSCASHYGPPSKTSQITGGGQTRGSQVSISQTRL